MPAATVPDTPAATSPNVLSEQSEDLLIVSADHFKLSISKQVFESASPVFHAMVKVNEAQRPRRPEIHVDAPASVLEKLFGYISPKTAGPSICRVDELALLFEMERRYKIKPLYQKLCRALVEITPAAEAGLLVPLFRKEPLKALFVAYRYNCTKELVPILAEVIRCRLDPNMHNAQSDDLPEWLMEFIRKERTKRADLLHEKLQDLFKYHAARACPVRLINRFLKMAAKELKVEPCFTRLEDLVKRNEDGAIPNGLLKLEAKDTMAKWRKEITAMENECQISLPSKKRIENSH